MEEKLQLLNDILKGLGESFRIEFKIVHKNKDKLTDNVYIYDGSLRAYK